MNYLQIAQRVAQEAGISGTVSTVENLDTGDQKRIASWVATAWDDIQRLHNDWRWMRSTFSFNTVAGTESYSTTDAGIASRFGRWDTSFLTLYLTSVGVNDRIELDYLPFEQWRLGYKIQYLANNRPQLWTVDSDRSLLFGPPPDAVYTVQGYYFKAPQTLTLDTDEPECPSEYHMAIVYRALQKYARFDAAGEIMQEAAVEYNRLMREMARTERPMVTYPDALA